MFAAGCGAPVKETRVTTLPDIREGAPVASGDSGLEVMWFGSTIEQGELAKALAAYADQPAPMSRELEALWNEHGMRVVVVPVDEVASLAERMQSSGVGGGMSQRQWLGQAYRWTEVARGPENSGNQTIALDAERIKVGPGAMRLLARSWLEPAPPAASVGVVTGDKEGSGGAMAVLRVELVPQHLEMNGRAGDEPFTLENPKIEAEKQGLLFTRLYSKMTMPAGRALVILSERPGVVWREVAIRAEEEDAARAKADEAKTQERVAERGSGNPWPEPAERARPAAQSTDEWGKVRIKEEGASAGGGGDAERGGTSTGAPGVGQVVRGARERPAVVSQPVEVAGPRAQVASGPSAVRVPTLGEAMLTRSGRMIDDKRREPTVRSVVILIPRVPKEFRLIGN